MKIEMVPNYEVNMNMSQEEFDDLISSIEDIYLSWIKLEKDPDEIKPLLLLKDRLVIAFKLSFHTPSKKHG